MPKPTFRQKLRGARRLFLIPGLVALALGALTIPVIVGVRYADRPLKLAAIVAAVVVIGVILAVIFNLLGARLGRRTILEIDAKAEFPEIVDDSPIAQFRNGPSTSFRDLLVTLDKAASDKRVAALFCRISQPPGGLARTQELHDAVAGFRKSGKPALAFLESVDGSAPFLLASAFDEVHLLPIGTFGTTGALAQVPFVKGTLDKLGVSFSGGKRHEYKNAPNMAQETGFTEPHREALGRVLESGYDQIVATVAERRGLDPDEAQAAMESGPLSAKEALDAGLVDKLSYLDQVVSGLKERVGKGARFVTLANYRKALGKDRSRGPVVALIHGIGGVVDGDGSSPNPTAGPKMASDPTAKAFRAARRDKSVKAIVFRVNSPGGSVTASEIIWRETVKAKEAGKAVIVSMSDVAGSGGYYVAAAADKIVAQPGTITGSIGVFGFKPVVADLQAKLGISTDRITIGPHATYSSLSVPYSKAEQARSDAFLDEVYDTFTHRVATGRSMKAMAVHKVAKGRIWTGSDALARGLVDELGGYDVAFRLAREAAGLKPDARIKVKEFPEKKGTLAKLRKSTGSLDEPAEAAAVAAAATGLQALATAVPGLGEILEVTALFGPTGDRTLAMPAFHIRW